MSNGAGGLRHRIIIQTPGRVSDGAGGSTVTWSTYKTVWARITEARGSEANRAETLHGVANYRIRFRSAAAPAVTTDMRVSYSGVLFAIKGISSPDFRDIYTDLAATTGEPA